MIIMPRCCTFSFAHSCPNDFKNKRNNIREFGTFPILKCTLIGAYQLAVMMIVFTLSSIG